MRRTLLALSTALLIATAPVFAQNYTGPWYNAAESGWGLNIVHQGDVLFPTWFTYDIDGKPMWLIVSGAPKQADGSYVGDVYRTTGVPFNQITGRASTGNVKLGTAKLTFASTGALNFSYSLTNQPTQSKALTRLAIGTGTPVCETTAASRASATNYSDIWWNPRESGWGINLFHQDNLMFATWFTYDSAGRDSWYVVSRAERQADGSFTGAIQQITRGTPYNQINGMPAVAAGAAPNVGNMTFRFSNGERGQMTYTIGAITQTKDLERQVFSGPAQICRSGAPIVVGGGGGGANATSNGCLNILALNQTRRVRQGTTAGPIEYIQRGMGAGTFEGQNSLMVDNFDTQNRRTARIYARINADGTYENVAAESFNETSGAMIARVKFSPNRFPGNLAVGASFTYSYTGTQEFFPPVPPSYVINYTQKFNRLPNESVTVPAGTFANACKMDIVTDTNTTTQGFAITARVAGPSWFDSQAGGLKIDSTVTGTAAGTTLPALREVTELLEFRNN